MACKVFATQIEGLAAVHKRLEEAVAGTTGALGLVHRLVGVPKEGVGAAVVHGERG